MSFPAAELALELVLALCFVCWFVLKGTLFVPGASWVCAGLLVLLPGMFLVPLPPAWWHSLVGRDELEQGLALVDHQQDWRSLALFPARAFSSWLGIWATACIIPMVAWLDRRGQVFLFFVLVLFGAVSLLVGLVQISGGDGNVWRFYYEAGDYLVGFQGNRNHQADVLLLVMLSLAALLRGLAQSFEFYPSRERCVGPSLSPWLVVLVVLCSDMALALGVVLTQSRTGMALLPLIMAGQSYLLKPLLPWRDKPLRIAIFLSLVIALAVVFLMGHDGPAGAAIARFGQEYDQRPEIWDNTINILAKYQGLGAGSGSFLRLYEPQEALESVSNIFVIRAHNDFLEFFLEFGLVGVATLLVIAGCIMRHIVKVDALVLTYSRAFGLLGLLELGLHSLFDYPLRTMALSGFAAFCVGLLLSGASALNNPKVLDGNR